MVLDRRALGSRTALVRALGSRTGEALALVRALGSLRGEVLALVRALGSRRGEVLALVFALGSGTGKALALVFALGSGTGKALALGGIFALVEAFAEVARAVPRAARRLPFAPDGVAANPSRPPRNPASAGARSAKIRK
ncbi:MAG: hypothetical protein SFV15_11515 [Polyangiaceae bacterium]|nr:hypothetical protein [Polyangiaceae bacterium]